MAKIERFEDLECWQTGRAFRRKIYRLTRLREFSRDYALVGQIRRAAISIGSNIAEGFERGGNREFIQFLSQAKGSTGEVKDQLYVALDEAYITQEQYDHAYALGERTGRLIGGFMSYLRKATITGHKFDTTSARANPKLKTQSPKP
ncbi:MAG: four helix bundle protein [Verrucomicrobia bacterium RIFCSPLOWO2_12_FULL_64_8]|nr:MAG: four helix bundle protein [Verrucomicrobia bacterium RIFCSPLOWO2_12_FULL_64_8]